MRHPAWILVNKLEMFSQCLMAKIPIILEIEDRLINIPSGCRISL